MNIIQWHKLLVERVQKELGISNYALYWFGFLEGAFVMWLIIKVVTVVTTKSAFPLY